MRHRDNAFDSVRLVAALAVLLSHAFPIYGLPEPFVAHHQTAGSLAVAAFFALSGYLVSQSWEREPRARAFLVKRALRIMPGLVVAALVTTLILGSLVTTLPLREYLTAPKTWIYIARNAGALWLDFRPPGVLDNAPMASFNGSLWTIRYEILMYLSLVLLRSRRAWCLAAFAACLLLNVVLLSEKFWVPGIWRLSVAFDVAQIARLGALFYGGACLWLYRVPLTWTASAVLLGLLCVAGNDRVATAVLAVAVPYLTLTLATRLRASLPADTSYGVYVYAFPVQQVASAYAHQNAHGLAWVLVVSTLGTVALATLSWFLVEKPALGLKAMLLPKVRAVTQVEGGPVPSVFGRSSR